MIKTTPSDTVRLLEADPDLGGLLTGPRRQEAERELVVRVHRLGVGVWDVSRLEGAMTRHDYAAASTLLAQLPAPMQQAAAPVAADIAAHAAADRLVTDLRARALSAAETKS